MGLLYHINFFTSINTAAHIFGVLFIAQVILFFDAGIWSVIGFTAAIKLEIPEDTGLLIAGILGVILLSTKNKKKREPAMAS